MQTGLCFGSCRIFCKGQFFQNMLDWTFPVIGRIHELNLKIDIFQIKVTFAFYCVLLL